MYDVIRRKKIDNERRKEKVVLPLLLMLKRNFSDRKSTLLSCEMMADSSLFSCKLGEKKKKRKVCTI